MEVGEADAHDFGTRLAVVAGPAAKACDDPGGEGQGSLGMRIALPLGLAFKLGRDGFEDGLVVRIKGIAQELIGVAVSRLHELLDSDGSNRSSSDEVDHCLRVTDICLLDIEACRFQGAEELLDRPTRPVEADHPTGVVHGRYSVGGQKPPMHRWTAIFRLRYLTDSDQR